MKSKFIVTTAHPFNWGNFKEVLTINKKGNVPLNMQGQEVTEGTGLHLFRLNEGKKVGAIISGNHPYQLTLVKDMERVFPPLGFWFRNSNKNKESYTLMIPTYESHYKLNLARFY